MTEQETIDKMVEWMDENPEFIDGKVYIDPFALETYMRGYKLDLDFE